MNNQTPLPVRRNHDPLNFHGDDVEQALSRITIRKDPEKKTHDLSDLGRMSAEAVMTQYEATALMVEDMGKTIKDMAAKVAATLVEYDTDMKRMVAETNMLVRDTATKLSEVLASCESDRKIIDETAAAIRDKGKHSQALIDQVSALSAEIRATCDEFKKKMG